VKPMGGLQRTNSYSSLDEAMLTGEKAGKVTSDDGQDAPPLVKAAASGTKLTMKRSISAEIIIPEEILPEAERLNVVIVSSEISPYSKSGGLADVADKLAAALAKIGHRVMTVAPLYKNYAGVEPTGVKRTFGLWDAGHTVEYCHGYEQVDKSKGVDHIFVKHGSFERAGMYGEGGMDYGDNLFRFALFAWAALEAPLVVPCGGVPYGEDIVFLANDWQAGFVPLILTSHYRRYKVYSKARCIFDIHNMGYQGPFPNPPFSQAPPFSFCDFGLRDNAYYDKYFWVYPEKDRAHALDKGEAIKLLKGGIEMSDRVITVAPSYCQEIMSVEGAWGMEAVTCGRFHHTSGILNGIDMKEWDPMNDKYLLPITFSKEDPSGKAQAKAKLQKELGLDVNPHLPIVAFIGRLAPQKGVDLIEEIFPWLLAHDQTGKGVTGQVQLVMMGSGEERYANFLRRAEAENKGKVCGYVGFTAEMEHKIIAGADILLMPSRYEPCGLPQMYAQRYGTIPVVHATGGLKDSVVQYNPFDTSDEGVGTGWKFDCADAPGLQFGLYNAINTFKNYKEAWSKMVIRAMKMNFSWEKSAAKYVEVFKAAKAAQPYINPLPFEN
jgi:starch synthase